MSFHSRNITSDYIHQYLESLDCPRALSIWIMFVANEHDQLAEMGFNPFHYNCVNAARDSLAATKFLSKAAFLKTSYNLEEVAVKKFFESERVCRETNQRIRKSTFSNSLTAHSIEWMRVKIADILGDFSADELADYAGWGPGATTKLPRRLATFPTKYDFENHITRDAYDFVKPWFNLAYPSWVIPEADFKIVLGSKLVTVAKDSRSDRTIAIEPGLNLWFQKGVGEMIGKRLLREGIDLSKQRHNQELSRIAAKFNNLATVDFSSASDTISNQLVEELLPSRWLELLKAFRSTFSSHGGSIIPLEKFSSMGNGYTFQLETLIFYVLALFVRRELGAKGRVSVYGDDVILPSAAFDLYVLISKDLGFTINERKSFSSSYYRESCGSHWWGNVSIKPIFLKDPLDGKTQIIKSANSLRLQAKDRNHSYGCDARLEPVWNYLVSHLGKNPPRISVGYGDCGLIDNLESAGHLKRPEHGVEGFYVRLWVPLAIHFFCESQGLLLSKVRAIGNNPDLTRPDVAGEGNNVPLPMRTKTARIRVLIPRWVDVGPWL